MKKKDGDQNSGDGDDGAREADLKIQLAKSQGDWERFATKLHDKNYHLRQRAQTAEGLAPTDKQAIVELGDVDLLKQYKELGTREEIESKGSKLVKLQRYQMVSEAAGVAGMNTTVLNRLLPDDAKLEIGEAEDDDGKAKRIVKITREGKDSIEVGKFAEKNWSDFLPALKAGSGEDEGSGTTWIQQSGSGGNDGGSNSMNPILKARMDRAQKRAHPKEKA